MITASLLADCMIRAKKVSGRGEESDNDIYWHTREACAELAREAKIKWPSVVSAYQMRSIWDSDIPDIPSDVWSRVVHPDILAREVLES